MSGIIKAFHVLKLAIRTYFRFNSGYVSGFVD